MTTVSGQRASQPETSGAVSVNTGGSAGRAAGALLTGQCQDGPSQVPVREQYPSAAHGGRGRYRTILADPPWRVDGSQNDDRPWCSKGGRRSSETFFPYQTQPLEWIKALPVSELAEQDAHLYLWVPVRFNRRGIGVQVAEAWGFEDVAEIVWRKPSFGLGKFPRHLPGGERDRRALPLLVQLG